MMATLFIGTPQIRMTQWMEEHVQLLLGIGVGILMVGLLLMVVSAAAGRKQQLAGYQVAEMNELKAKAVD
jgi:hypothetical protein